MAEAPDIRIRLTAEGLTEVVDALKKVVAQSAEAKKGAEGINSIGAAFERVQGLLAKVGIAVGIAEAVRGTKELFDSASELTRELGNMSEEFGGATSKSVGLAIAAKVTETELTSVRTGIANLSRATAQLGQDVGGRAVEALRALGFTARDFRGRDLADQFALVAQRLATMTSGQQKANEATAIFGKRIGLELIPLLNLLGRQGFEGLRKQLADAFSPEVLARITALRQELAIFDLQVKGVAAEFLSGFAGPMQLALESVSRSLANNADSWRGWGGAIGRVAAVTTIVFANLVDALVTGTQQLTIRIGQLKDLALAIPAGPVNGAADLKKAQDAQKKIDQLEADFRRRRDERHDQVAAIAGGQVAPVDVAGPGTPGIDAADEAAVAQRLQQLKEAAAAELALARARISAEDEAQRVAFSRGLTSIRDYYAERRRIQQQGFELEAQAIRDEANVEVRVAAEQVANAKKASAEQITELRKRLAIERESNTAQGDAAAKKTEGEIAAQTAAAQTREAGLQADLEEKKADAKTRGAAADLKLQTARIGNQGALAKLDQEEIDAISSASAEWLAVEKKLLELRGQRHSETLQQIDEELRKADQIIERLKNVHEATFVGPQAAPGALPGDDAFTRQAEQVTRSIDEFRRQRNEVIDEGRREGLDAETIQARVAQLEQSRLPVLRQITDELVKSADALGRASAKDTAGTASRQLKALEVGAAENAVDRFSSRLERAQAALTDLDTKRSAISDRVAAGIESQLQGTREVLDLETQRVAKLRELADELRQLAAATGNQEFAKQADDFDRQARLVEIHVQASTDVLDKLKATAEDSGTAQLANFFSDGIDKAHGFTDAILGVIRAVRRMVSEMLAAAVIRTLFGVGQSASGGDSAAFLFHPHGAARGGLVPGFAVGGRVERREGARRGAGGAWRWRGPGTGTSDSITTRVPRGTFILNARASGIPAVVRRVHEMLQTRGERWGNAIAAGAGIPVRVSTGEIGVAPEIVSRPGFRDELERLNRGVVTPALRAQRFAAGGVALEGGIQSASGAAGAPGSAGSAGTDGADGTIRVQVGLEDGLIERRVERLLAGPRGPKLVVGTVARAPRSARRAIGAGG